MFLAKSQMAPRYQYPKTIQWRTNGQRRPSRDRKITPPISPLLASQCYNERPGELYIYTLGRRLTTTKKKIN
jgi:hypothetical protein